MSDTNNEPAAETEHEDEVHTATAEAQERPADQVDTPEGQVRVHILKPFTLRLDSGPLRGEAVTYTPKGTNCGLPGYYDLDAEVADHWYVRLNSDNPPPLPPPVPGTQAAVEVEHQKIARRRLVQAVELQQEQQAAENVRRGRQRQMREKLGDSFEQAP